MRAFRLSAPFTAAVVELPIPAPAAGEVLLRARRTVISTGTAIRQYRDERVAQDPTGREVMERQFWVPSSVDTLVASVIPFPDKIRSVEISLPLQGSCSGTFGETGSWRIF